MSHPSNYNYPHYVPGEGEEEDFARFPGHLKVGSQAPEWELTRLSDLKKVKLSDLAARSSVVLEFGSFT